MMSWPILGNCSQSGRRASMVEALLFRLPHPSGAAESVRDCGASRIRFKRGGL